ncbi:MAG: dihydropteroate synthase [Phaeodactylibacter sp.]|nr:dihydropteroate synthase [Phaeodactylibacter sp.]
MGILNVTPDSFFDGGRYKDLEAAYAQAGQMLEHGATFIDVGGMSSRPGAELISIDEELERVIPVIEGLVQRFPEILISVDTIRAAVAREAVAAGAALVNDISAGRFDPDLYATVGALGVPYILMHMQGEPGTMQQQPHYDDVLQEVLDFFIAEVDRLREQGVKDILLDPGFGFGKTVAHNYQLLGRMHLFQILDLPILAGLSRKSMICKVLKVAPKDALNGTTALHMIALEQGAKILRVHDVQEAMQTVKLFKTLTESIKQLD